MNKRHQSIRLTNRDKHVLEHVCRYTITTADALKSLPCIDANAKHSVQALKRRLLAGGYLNTAELYHRRRYLFLTRQSFNTLGIPPTKFAGKPLNLEAKIRAYAILCFCCCEPTNRNLLTDPELEKFFPGVSHSRGRSRYYIDRELDHNRLAYLRVDFGSKGPIRRETVITYLRRDAEKLVSNPALIPFYRQDRLQITFLTALESKAMRIQEAIEQRDDELPVHIRVHFIPELRELACPVKW